MTSPALSGYPATLTIDYPDRDLDRFGDLAADGFGGLAHVEHDHVVAVHHLHRGRGRQAGELLRGDFQLVEKGQRQ